MSELPGAAQLRSIPFSFNDQELVPHDLVPWSHFGKVV